MARVKAETVFTEEAGFGPELIARIMAAGEGKIVRFPGPAGTTQGRMAGTVEELLEAYARGEPMTTVCRRMGISSRRGYVRLAEERTRAGSGLQVAVCRWRDRGLSWREIGRLLGMSHEAARRMGGREEGGERKEEERKEEETEETEGT